MSRHVWWGAAMLASVCVLPACSPTNVSFSGEVQPILKQRCLECHVPGQIGYEKSGFDVRSYDSLIKGGKFGPLVKPGDAFTSAFNMLVENRAHPSIRMPYGREKLSDREIEILKVWVNEGAKNN